MRSTDELARHAEFLRNAAPQQFHRFYQAFSQYTDEVLNLMITTPPEQLLVVQGQAQQCKKLWDMFDKVEKETGNG